MSKKIALFLSLMLLPGLACQILAPAAAQPNTPSATDVALAVQQTLQSASQEAGIESPTVQPVTPAETQSTNTWPPTATAQPTRPQALQPTGLRVAYSLTGDVYVWQPGGQSQRLTEKNQASDVRLSDDGVWIAYTKTINQHTVELWAVKSDGSTDTLLIGASDFESPGPNQFLIPDQFEWVPGSHDLLFTTYLEDEGPGQPPSNDLRRVNADHPDQKTILLSPGQGGRFFLSPDHQKLLMVRSDRFLIANSDGSDLRQVFTFPYVMTYSEWNYLPDPIWNSDSSSFRVIIPPQDPLSRPEEATVAWQIPVDGSPAQQLGSFQASPAFQFRPMISPDGNKVAYQKSKNADSVLSELHVLTLGQNDSRMVLRAGGLVFRDWAPDSQRFTFQSQDRKGIQIVDLNGKIQALPVGISPFQLAWVDRQNILVLSGNIEAPELYLVLLGGRSFSIASSPAPDLNFDFIK